MILFSLAKIYFNYEVALHFENYNLISYYCISTNQRSQYFRESLHHGQGFILAIGEKDGSVNKEYQIPMSFYVTWATVAYSCIFFF